jgi:hypothetical protein
MYILVLQEYVGLYIAFIKHTPAIATESFLLTYTNTSIKNSNSSIKNSVAIAGVRVIKAIYTLRNRMHPTRIKKKHMYIIRLRENS